MVIYRLNVPLMIIGLCLTVLLLPSNLVLAQEKLPEVAVEQREISHLKSHKVTHEAQNIGIFELLKALIDIVLAAAQEDPLQIIEKQVEISGPQSPKVTLNAKDIDIRDLLRALAKKGNLNLVIDNSVQGRISFNLKDMPAEKAIELILRSNGYVLEKTDEYIIAASPSELKNLLPAVTKAITLQHTTAAEMKENLISLVSDEKSIQADTRTNSLIITDIASMVEKLEQIITTMDVDAPEEFKLETITKVFPLKYADAAALQMSLNNLLSDVGKIQAESRANSLIVIDIPSVIEELTEIINQFDTKTSEVMTEVDLVTRVLKLNYIDANALMETLQNIISSQGKIQTFVRQKDSIVPTTKQGAGRPTKTKSGEEDDEEKWSDTLIVTDTPAVVQQIEELIRQLDTKTPQVMIEARITELSVSDNSQLGIDWQAVHSKPNGELSAKFPSAEEIGMRLQVGTLSPGDFEDITAILQLLQMEGKAKVLSNPKIITLDNELAEIIVADRFPVRTTYETELRATTAYEYMNVGIILTVTPHISEDGYIIIDVKPEVDFIKETPAEGPPVISSRSAHTRVGIKDGETFVIGGLMKEENVEIVRRTPILGRIPILGMLFRSTTKETQKTDLVVFITPHIYGLDNKP